MNTSAIHEAVESYWGERCPDHDPDCPTCKAWQEYDAMKGDNRETAMTKEDWIILRLLMTTSKVSLSNDLDIVLSVMHLIKKYGRDVVNNCIDQLHTEKTK
jgi:hypothetical protein